MVSSVFVEPMTSELSWFMDESTVVIQKETTSKSLDVVDETRAKRP